MQEKRENTEATVEIDLKKLVWACLRGWWFIILCALAAGIAAFLITSNYITPMYRSTCALYINNSSSNIVYDSLTTSSISASQSLVPTYKVMIGMNDFLSQVAEELNNSYTAEQLGKMITTEQIDNTQYMRVYVSSSDPKEAYRIAGVLYRLIPEVIPSVVEGSSAKQVGFPEVPAQPYTPNTTKNTVIGLLAGFVLSAFLLVLRSLLDVRIKNAEDLENIAAYPVLGQIPLFNAKEAKKSGYGYGEKPADTGAEKGARS